MKSFLLKDNPTGRFRCYFVRVLSKYVIKINNELFSKQFTHTHTHTQRERESSQIIYYLFYSHITLHYLLHIHAHANTYKHTPYKTVVCYVGYFLYYASTEHPRAPLIIFDQWIYSPL